MDQQLYNRPAFPQDNVTEMCRIRVRFGNPPLEVCYRDECSVAERFATAARGTGAEVVIDHVDHPGLPPLPCRTLWDMDA